MLSFNKLSIRSKIALPIIVSVCIAIISFESYLHFGALEDKKQNLVERVSALARGVAVNLSAAVVFNDSYGATEVLAAFSVDPDVLSVAIHTNNSDVFSQYQKGKNDKVEYESEFIDKSKHHTLPFFTEQYLFIHIPILLDREKVASMHIVVSLDRLNVEISEIEMFAMSILMLISLVGYLIIHRIQQWVINPVVELNQAMIQIIQGDNNISRPETTTNDELGDLVNCFNDMLDKLQERDAQIRASLNKQKLAADVFENIRDGLIVVDNSAQITMVNSAITKLFGYQSEELVGQKLNSILDWRKYPTLKRTIQDSLINYGQWQGEVTEKSKSGESIPIFVRASLIRIENSPKQNKVVFTVSDIRSTKEVERLEHLAHHDYLTGLSNRAHLYQTLDSTCRANIISNQQFAVLYLDLDGFKLINDTHGHDAGDEVLTIISQRLQNHVRASDTVARLSGDEFVLVLTPINTEQTLIDLSERLLSSINETITYKGTELRIGVSIGINIINEYHNDNYDYDAILKGADTAMYHSKAQGKGCYTLIYNSDSSIKNLKVINNK